jgi:ribosomal protein L32E
MKTLAATVAVMAALGGTAHADDLDVVRRCTTIREFSARLECFDAYAQAVLANESKATANTKEIIAAKATEFKRTDAQDLQITPQKFIERGVEVAGFQCFHADKNEFRCIHPSATVMVLTVKVKPDIEQAKLEDDCGSIKTAVGSPKCRRTLRFVPLKAENDKIDGYRSRTIVLASEVEVVSSQRPRR